MFVKLQTYYKTCISIVKKCVPSFINADYSHEKIKMIKYEEKKKKCGSTTVKFYNIISMQSVGCIMSVDI